MTLDKEQKIIILDDYFELVAEQLGDITSKVIGQFYQDYPSAEQMLEQHVYGNKAELEASMVESSLHCVMVWLERPFEIRTALNDAVSFHESIKIPGETLSWLLNSLLKVLGTVPPTENTKTAQNILAKIVSELNIVITDSRSTIV